MKKIFITVMFCLITSCSFAESYQILNDGYIQRQSDLALIPPTIENKDYTQYLEDKKNGAETKPFDYEAAEQRRLIAQAKNKIEKDKEKLIWDKIREMAITALIAEGKIDN